MRDKTRYRVEIKHKQLEAACKFTSRVRYPSFSNRAPFFRPPRFFLGVYFTAPIRWNVSRRVVREIFPGNIPPRDTMGGHEFPISGARAVGMETKQRIRKTNVTAVKRNHRRVIVFPVFTGRIYSSKKYGSTLSLPSLPESFVVSRRPVRTSHEFSFG